MELVLGANDKEEKNILLSLFLSLVLHHLIVKF